MMDMFQTTNNEPQTSVENFDYKEAKGQLDKMNRELKEMKESMLKTCLRAHILETELSCLVNPEVVEALHNVQETCKDCTLAMKLEDLEKSND